MEAQYDLFEMKPDGYPRWVGAAASLEHARIRLRDLAQSSLGSDYFVRDFYSGSVVAVANKRSRPRPAAAAPRKRSSRAAVGSVPPLRRENAHRPSGSYEAGTGSGKVDPVFPRCSNSITA
jgi:hypothetical protein